MSNDVKLEPFKKRFHVEGQTSTQGPRWQIWDGERHCARFKNIADRTDADNLCEALNTRHQPQERETVLEQALLQCASRFSAYAELHAEKLWDGSLSEAQRQTVRDKVDRNLRYAAEARAALATPTDAALLADICDNMAEVLKPLPGEE